MLPLLKAVSLALFLELALAFPSMREPMIVHERRDTVTSRFAQNGPAPNDQLLDLRIALVQNDRQGLERTFLNVSTPGNAQYGKFLSKEEVEAFVAPSPATFSAVTKFLADNGINASNVTSAGDMLSIRIPVQQANSLFDTQFHSFTDLSNGKACVRTLSYSIPAVLKSHVDYVHPTIACVQDMPHRLPI